jgi:hypothetical protein
LHAALAALALLDACFPHLLALIAVLRVHVAGGVGLQASGRTRFLGNNGACRRKNADQNCATKKQSRQGQHEQAAYHCGNLLATPAGHWATRDLIWDRVQLAAFRERWLNASSG